MKNLNFKQLILFSVLIILSNQAIAEKTNNYGRIYNVQDYIDETNIQNPGPNNDLLGTRRCFSEVNQHIYNNSTAVVTIIFPMLIRTSPGLLDIIYTLKQYVTRKACPVMDWGLYICV